MHQSIMFLHQKKAKPARSVYKTETEMTKQHNSLHKTKKTGAYTKSKLTLLTFSVLRLQS